MFNSPTSFALHKTTQLNLHKGALSSAMLEAFKHCKYTNNFQTNKQKTKKNERIKNISASAIQADGTQEVPQPV